MTVTLAYSGTATNLLDYTRSGTSIVIAAGTLFNTVTLTAVDDLLDENNETIVVDIASVTNGTEAGVQQVTATITDDDAPPTLSVGDVSVVEGNAGTTSVVFTVTLSAVSSQTVTVIVGSADDTATNGSDYVALPPTTLTFAPGETSQTVTVTVNGDLLFEADETYLVNLSGAVNAAVLDDEGVGTIVNDDVDPTTIPGFVGLVGDPRNPGQTMLLVVGTIGNDQVNIRGRYHGQQLIVTLNRVNAGIFDNRLVSRIVSHGNAGNDRIVVDTALGKSAELRGGAGNDSLYGGAGQDELFGGDGNDYLDGRSGNDRLYGENGNDRIYGRAGHDMLLGGDGNDKLYGGNDRDILIGGIGRDSLYGQAGDDILIGGETIHDADKTALLAIQSEWTSGNSYDDRVANIRDGSGVLPGQNGAFNLDETTSVIDDGEIDQLFGGGNQDWFFNFDSANDLLRDKRTNEQLN